MKKINLLVGLFCLFITAMQAQDNNSFSVQLTIENGIIEGNYDTKSGIQKYFGIPFAKPPVGNLRWKAPQPLDNWKGVKETKKFGPRPMQKTYLGRYEFPLKWCERGLSLSQCMDTSEPQKQRFAGIGVLFRRWFCCWRWF